MADVQMESASVEIGAVREPPFSEQEKEILDMYDQVQKLEVEVALTRARVLLAGQYAPLRSIIIRPADGTQMKTPKTRAREQELQTTQTLKTSKTPASSCLKLWLCTTFATTS